MSKTRQERNAKITKKTIVPASPGYFILVAGRDEGGVYRIDNRTPVIAWLIDAADVEFDAWGDAEAIGINKFSDDCPQAVIGLDDKISLCSWNSSFEGKAVEEWLEALTDKAAASAAAERERIADHAGQRRKTDAPPPVVPAAVTVRLERRIAGPRARRETTGAIRRTHGFFRYCAKLA